LAGKENKTLLQRIANESVSTVKTSQLSLPIKHKEKVLYLALGASDHIQWKMRCTQAHGAAYRVVSKSPDNSRITALQNLAKGYDKVVISFHQPKVWAQSNGGYTGADFRLVSAMAKIKPTIVVGFCNPYILNRFVQPVTVVAAYEDNEYFQNAAFDMIHGTITASGHIPVTRRYTRHRCRHQASRVAQHRSYRESVNRKERRTGLQSAGIKRRQRDL
jgi:hypothetical protein